jgi:polyisoprenoid-binding protein YceI
MHRRSFLAFGLAAIASPGHSVPRPYTLAPGRATITYTFWMNGNPVKGTVPIDTAELIIDPSNLAASTADVTADVRRARTGLIFATEALKSPSVLHARAFPLARFQSTRVILGPQGRISDGAALEGLLTLRGKTQPVRFDATLFRVPGSRVGDFDTLTVTLTGQVNRREFGAVGYSDIVGDIVGIDITAEISVAD